MRRTLEKAIACAFVLVGALHQQWLAWAVPKGADLNLDAPMVQAD